MLTATDLTPNQKAAAEEALGQGLKVRLVAGALEVSDRWGMVKEIVWPNPDWNETCCGSEIDYRFGDGLGLCAKCYDHYLDP